MKRSYPVEVERPPNKRNFPNGFNQNHFNGAKVPGCAQNKTTPTSFYHVRLSIIKQLITNKFELVRYLINCYNI